MSYNYLFKIVIVGDHNCGKSCILLRFAENSFRQDHITTLGVDFKLKTVKLGRDKIRLELWDTAGMERYRTIYNSYYHSAHGIMCVYDLTDERSFDNLRNYWLKEIRVHAPSNAVLMLIGNKADLEDKRTVNFERAEQLASQLGVSLYEVLFQCIYGILIGTFVRALIIFFISMFFSSCCLSCQTNILKTIL
ncbi:unnamed protein product [Litomosoides sigmodontis]|uniref:Uncharacterized protein n=1 Tax=Litomosoides sigmodontis TaxID=42156 RepID=A0A3P6T6C7_LITSI|nr:unnamed protein product [Litomosoides sigmodontis]